MRVEKRMEVGAQQDSVCHVITFAAGILDDVGSLKDMSHVTPGDGTPATVLPNQRFAEFTLALTLHDLSFNAPSRVREVSGIENHGQYGPPKTFKEINRCRCGI